MEPYIRCEERGPVALVTLSRPEALNALNAAVLEELCEVMDRLDGRRQVKVVILTGAGEKAFAAGADIAAMREMTPEAAAAFSRTGHRTMDKVASMRAVTIAAVNGYALGGGCELALACDIRIASTRAKMGIPEASLGVIPGFGGTQRLPRLVGLSRAIELLATGRPCGAEECREMGLVDRVAEPEGLMDACMELAETISRNSATAIAHGKQCMRAGLERELGEALELEQRVFAMNFTEADQREGMSAFLEKRPAAFR